MNIKLFQVCRKSSLNEIYFAICMLPDCILSLYTYFSVVCENITNRNVHFGFLLFYFPINFKFYMVEKKRPGALWNIYGKRRAMILKKQIEHKEIFMRIMQFNSLKLLFKIR